MRGIPFPRKVPGQEEPGAWHKPTPSLSGGTAVQGYTLTRRKQRFSSKPGQDLGNFLCRSYHSLFKRREPIPGTLKPQEVGWWFQREQNHHFLSMVLLMRTLRSPQPHQLPECVELRPCHSLLHSRASGFSAALFQKHLFTLSCSLTIIVIKSRTLRSSRSDFHIHLQRCSLLDWAFMGC